MKKKQKIALEEKRQENLKKLLQEIEKEELLKMEGLENRILAILRDPCYVINRETAQELSKIAMCFSIREQLELLENFYYGKDLNDPDIRKWYKFLLKSCKEDLERTLKTITHK